MRITWTGAVSPPALSMVSSEWSGATEGTIWDLESSPLAGRVSAEDRGPILSLKFIAKILSLKIAKNLGKIPFFMEVPIFSCASISPISKVPKLDRDWWELIAFHIFLFIILAHICCQNNIPYHRCLSPKLFLPIYVKTSPIVGLYPF